MRSINIMIYLRNFIRRILKRINIQFLNRGIFLKRSDLYSKKKKKFISKESNSIVSTSIRMIQTPKLSKQELYRTENGPKNVFQESVSQNKSESKPVTPEKIIRRQSKSVSQRKSHPLHPSINSPYYKNPNLFQLDSNNTFGTNLNISKKVFQKISQENHFKNHPDPNLQSNRINFELDLVYDPEALNDENFLVPLTQFKTIKPSPNHNNNHMIKSMNKENSYHKKKPKRTKSKKNHVKSHSNNIHEIASPKFPQNNSISKIPLNNIIMNNQQYVINPSQHSFSQINNGLNQNSKTIKHISSYSCIPPTKDYIVRQPPYDQNQYQMFVEKKIKSDVIPQPNEYNKLIKMNSDHKNLIYKQKCKKKKFLSNRNSVKQNCSPIIVGDAQKQNTMFSISKEDYIKFQHFQNNHKQPNIYQLNKSKKNLQNNILLPQKNLMIESQQNKMNNYFIEKQMSTNSNNLIHSEVSPERYVMKHNIRKSAHVQNNNHFIIYSENNSEKYSQQNNSNPFKNRNDQSLYKNLRDMNKDDFKIIFDLLDFRGEGILSKDNFKFSSLPLKTMNEIEPFIKEMLVREDEVDFNQFTEILLGMMASLN